MISRSAHVFDISCSQTFLAAGRASELELDVAQKVVFERVHSGRREQNRLVPFRDQHITVTYCVPFAFEKVQIFFTNFVSLHLSVPVLFLRLPPYLGSGHRVEVSDKYIRIPFWPPEQDRRSTVLV